MSFSEGSREMRYASDPCERERGLKRLPGLWKVWIVRTVQAIGMNPSFRRRCQKAVAIASPRKNMTLLS